MKLGGGRVFEHCKELREKLTINGWGCKTTEDLKNCCLWQQKQLSLHAQLNSGMRNTPPAK